MSRDFEKEDRMYRVFYSFLRPIVKLLFKPVAYGFNNMPDGPAVICANHTNGWDPLLFLYCVGKNNNIRFMIKKELENSPVLGSVLKKMGEIFVDRNSNDIKAVKDTLYLLKAGKKVFIFPEGTRTDSDGSVDPKKGALKIAAKVKCPIVPVNIPRNKRLFASNKIIMGKPFFVYAKTNEEFDAEAKNLMHKIYSLSEGN